MLVLALLVVLALSRVVLRGEVIAPHPNDIELAVKPVQVPGHILNRKFSDFSSGYIPALQAQLNGRSPHWMPFWNPYNGLGRPSTTLASASRAFLVTNLLGYLVRDAYRLYTLLVILTFLLAAWSGYGFFRAQSLTPPAAFAGAVVIAFSFQMVYWSTFLVFLTPTAFSLLILWTAERFLATRRIVPWVGMVLGIHGLGMSGYPQQAVFYLYFIATYLAWSVFVSGRVRAGRWAGIAGLGLAGAAGVAITLPVLADVYRDSENSIRVLLGDQFLMRGIGDIKTLGGYSRAALEIFDPFWSGNPIRPESSLLYDGFSLNPAILALLLASLVPPILRRSLPLHVVLLILILFTFNNGLRLFSIHHLGFGLSRYVMLQGAIIPVGWVVAITVEHWQDTPARVRLMMPVIGLTATFLILVRIESVAWTGSPPDVLWGVAGAIVLVILAIYSLKSRAWLLGLLAISIVLIYGRPLVLSLPAGAIHRNSELTEALSIATSRQNRYAVFWSRPTQVLPPNQDSALGLFSIHVYDSLMPKALVQWFESRNVGTTTSLGRAFRSISSPEVLTTDVASKLAISTFLTDRPVASNGFQLFQQIGGFYLYSVIRKPQWAEFIATPSGSPSRAASAPATVNDAVQFNMDMDDIAHLRLRKGLPQGSIRVSIGYHSSWVATSSTGTRLRTFPIDGPFLGIEVPAGTTAVKLEFQPYLRFAWISQALLMAMLVLAGITQISVLRRPWIRMTAHWKRPSRDLQVFETDQR